MFVVAIDPVDLLIHALCGLRRPFEIFNSKRKLFYYHLVTPQCRTHGVILLCAQRTAMLRAPTSDSCDQLIFRGNLHIFSYAMNCSYTAGVILIKELKIEVPVWRIQICDFLL